jgi:P27 family predicted phage terminase small subunit
MAKPGPRPTPTQVLRLRGSWRAKRNPTEPQPEVAMPEAPAWLSDVAQKVFNEYAERLHAAGVLTEVDELALARYADLCVQYRRASEFVAKHGDAYVVRGRRGPQGEEGLPTGFKTYPQAKRLLQLANVILQLEREFGLTPAARAGLSAREPYVDEPDVSDYYFGTGLKA